MKKSCFFIFLVGFAFFWPGTAGAHCNTMDGPVAQDAGRSIPRGDVTPVLKWVRKEDEDEIRTAFEETQKARNSGPEARKIADLFFLETLIRVHRAGEGAPYTGLLPAGTPLDMGIGEADQSLQQGTVKPLLDLLLDHVRQGVEERFKQALDKKKHAEESVDHGREYVRAYVDYVHCVERLFKAAEGNKAHAHSDECGCA